MRSDWHRYNLKRKVADLPPVSSEDYDQKVLVAQASTTAAQQSAAFATACTICQKTYYSENAYQNHLLSKQHKAKAASASLKSTSLPSASEETIPAEAEEEFENVVAALKDTQLTSGDALQRPEAPAPGIDREEHLLSPPKVANQAQALHRCLFCNYESPNIKLNTVHMQKIHGMFVPEQSYLVDLEGLVGYLQAKVHENYECIKCHKLKNSAEGIQTHMRDKQHCMIAFESEEEMIEIGQFYDFSSTYSDDEADSDTEDGAEVAEDEDWETDSDESSVASDEITAIPNDDHSDAYKRMKMSKHHSSSVAQSHKSADGYHSRAHQHNNAVFYDDHELHLPSGRIAGHRAFKKYFRQNLHNYPSQAERLARQHRLIADGSDGEAQDDDEEMIDANGTPRTRALTRRSDMGMIGVTSTQREEVKKAEQRGRTQAQKQQSRYQAKLEKQANSQKHFRDPLLQ